MISLRKTTKVLLSILLASVIAQEASANVEALVSLKQPGAAGKRDMQLILQDKRVKSSRGIYTAREQKILAGLKLESYGEARVITLDNNSDFKALALRARREKMAVRVEANQLEVQISSVAEPLEYLQWAYGNKGEPQSIELDHRTTNYVPGKAGEDMRLPDGFPAKQEKAKIVAVLDTGVDHTHPELAPMLVRNETECALLEKFKACVKEKGGDDKARQSCEETWYNHPEADQDKNGYPLDCSGWSLLGGKNKADILGRPDFDDNQEGHGTHVAGIIAARTGNNEGVRGVARNVKILPVQVVGDAPSAPLKPQSVGAPAGPNQPPEPGDSNPKERNRRRPVSLAEIVARGVIYALQSKADVINFSMGWPNASDSEYMRSLLKEAQARGAVIVASAGNDSTQALISPCAYPGVVCVGAHGPDGALAHFSNYGVGVDLAAPGVNILSTWPIAKRPIRYRQGRGYEYMFGTSQATPYVSGVVAEFLAAGMSADEAYARLILGARPHTEPLAFITANPHELDEAKTQAAKSRQDQDRNFTLAGNMDVSGALAVKPQPLIVPAGKDRMPIYWDRRTSDLRFSFFLKNYWQSAPAGTQVTAKVVGADKPGAIRPRLDSLSSEKTGAWAAGEVRKFNAELRIVDSADPSKSRIPSEIDLDVTVSIPGGSTRTFLARAEVIVPIDEKNIPAEAQEIPFPTLPKPQGPTSSAYLMLVYEKLDADGIYNDFLHFMYNPDEITIQLIRQDRTGDTLRAPYKLGRKIIISEIPGNPERLLEKIRARIDLDGDGVSEYVVGLMEDNRQEEKPGPSPITFYYFSNDFKLLSKQTYTSKMAQFPFHSEGSNLVGWMRNKTRKVPVWIGAGKDPYKKFTRLERWENFNKDNEKKDIRFYYLDEESKLQAVDKYKDDEGKEYRLADLLRPTEQQVKEGRVPVLLAKDSGTQRKPSYIYDFAMAEMYEGKVTNFRKVNFFQQGGIPYRSLLDTRTDAVRSLDYTGERYLGTYWFSTGRIGEQRLSVLNSTDQKFSDFSFPAIRGRADASLWVRGTFASKYGISAWVLTNSELQFHDHNGESVYRSLERYTFYEDNYTSTNQYPLVVADTRLDVKLPAIYTTEISQLVRGIRVTIPVYDANGKVVELANPARLRFKSSDDCKPLNAPVWAGADKPFYFDYQCETKLVRIPLVY